MVSVHEEYELSVEVRIVDGDPRFREVVLRCFDPMAPLDLQRLPWARIAEGAVAANAVEDASRQRASGAQVLKARARARKAAARRARAEDDTAMPGRRRVSQDRLDEVLRLRAEAQNLGVRWDTYAEDKTGYSATYLRKLASRADQERT